MTDEELAKLDEARALEATMMARSIEVQGFLTAADLWRNPDSDTTHRKAALTYLASCLPEGYSIADLPPMLEKDNG